MPPITLFNSFVHFLQSSCLRAKKTERKWFNLERFRRRSNYSSWSLKSFYSLPSAPAFCENTNTRQQSKHFDPVLIALAFKVKALALQREKALKGSLMRAGMTHFPRPCSAFCSHGSLELSCENSKFMEPSLPPLCRGKPGCAVPALEGNSAGKPPTTYFFFPSFFFSRTALFYLFFFLKPESS